MRTAWRMTRPLSAAAAATSSLSLRGSLASRRLGARQFLGVSAVRWEAEKTASVSTASAKDKETQSTRVATTVEVEVPVELPVDLKDVGAEATKVLTIADVLTRREAELTQQGTAAPYFDEWESIPATHSIQDAIDLMVECNIGSLIVTEENAGIVGIVTERDVMKKTSPRTLVQDQDKFVKEIMSSQIMCIPSTTTVIDALATMSKENIRHLAVINGEISAAVKKGSVPEEAMRCVLSIQDIVKAYSQFEALKKKATEAPSSTPPEPESSTPTEKETIVAEPSAVSDSSSPSTTPTEATATSPLATPIVTAASLLKKKHKKIKLILNTRGEDNITVAEAVDEMTKHDFGAVLIVDKEQRVQGIFTERDYLTRVLYPKEDPTRMKVTDVCTKKLSFFQTDDSLEKCWTQAAEANFRHFPVIGLMRKDREKELAGILSIKDIVREISKGHASPSGFKLMEFFKSKIAKETPPPTPAPTSGVVPSEDASSKKEEQTESEPTPPQKKNPSEM